MTTLSETDPQLTQQPAKRAQFPLWFLLFVIPTIAGLGFAIYSNWKQQSQVRAELVAHQAILKAEIETLESEIALVRQIDLTIQGQADKWKSAEEVIRSLKGQSAEWETIGFGFIEIPIWHDSHTFLLQADEADLHQLVSLLREEFRKGSDSTKFAFLCFVAHIPDNAPQHVETLSEDVQQLVELISTDDDPRLKMKEKKIREAFNLVEVADGEEGQSE